MTVINSEDLFRSHGVAIELSSPEDFLKVKETLTRMGVANEKTKTLWQSVHILHKQGKYALMHFKEMFAMDGRESTLDDADALRRDVIAQMLQDWNLIKITKANWSKPEAPVHGLRIIKHSEKHDWKLEPKYQVGRKHYFHGSS